MDTEFLRKSIIFKLEEKYMADTIGQISSSCLSPDQNPLETKPLIRNRRWGRKDRKQMTEATWSRRPAVFSGDTQPGLERDFSARAGPLHQDGTRKAGGPGQMVSTEKPQPVTGTEPQLKAVNTLERTTELPGSSGAAMPRFIEGKGAWKLRQHLRPEGPPTPRLEKLVKGGGSRGLEESFKAKEPDAEALPCPRWFIIYMAERLSRVQGPQDQVPSSHGGDSPIGGLTLASGREASWILSSCQGHQCTYCWADWLGENQQPGNQCLVGAQEGGCDNNAP